MPREQIDKRTMRRVIKITTLTKVNQLLLGTSLITCEIVTNPYQIYVILQLTIKNRSGERD